MSGTHAHPNRSLRRALVGRLNDIVDAQLDRGRSTAAAQADDDARAAQREAAERERHRLRSAWNTSSPHLALQVANPLVEPVTDSVLDADPRRDLGWHMGIAGLMVGVPAEAAAAAALGTYAGATGTEAVVAAFGVATPVAALIGGTLGVLFNRRRRRHWRRAADAERTARGITETRPARWPRWGPYAPLETAALISIEDHARELLVDDVPDEVRLGVAEARSQVRAVCLELEQHRLRATGRPLSRRQTDRVGELAGELVDIAAGLAGLVALRQAAHDLIDLAPVPTELGTASTPLSDAGSALRAEQRAVARALHGPRDA